MTDHDWDDERLGAAFTSLFDRPAPAGLAERTIAAAREPALEPRRWAALPGRWRAAAVIAAFVVAASASFALFATPIPIGTGPHDTTPPTAADPSGLTSYDDGQVHFLYPSSWASYGQLPSTSGPGQVLALLGTLPVDPSCGEFDYNCYEQEKLKPGTLKVVVSSSTTGQTIFDVSLAATDRWVTINGLPAIVSDRGHVPTDYYESDLSIGWLIATPTDPSQVIRIEALIKGPGTDAMRTQVEAMVESLAFLGPSAATIPPGQQGIDLARSAATKATDLLDLKVHSLFGGLSDQDTIYRCIPSDRWAKAAGSSDTTLAVSADHDVVYGPNGWLGGREQVHCVGTIEATSGLYWKLVLVVIGGTDSSGPGQVYTETDWLAADGTLLQSTSAGLVPASRIDQGPTMQYSMAIATAAAISELTNLGDFYQCFPTTPGATASGVITTDPLGATKYSTVPVTCTTNIEPRPDGLAWRLILDAHWSADGDGRTAGDIVATIDVDAAGAPGTPVVTGDELPQGPTPVTGPPTPTPQESPASP